MKAEEFTTTVAADAYAHAIRKAKYGHRDWIVWKGTAGTYHATRLGPEPLRRALADHETGKRDRPLIFQVCAHVGHLININRELADVYLANMDAGQFPYC